MIAPPVQKISISTICTCYDLYYTTNGLTPFAGTVAVRNALYRSARVHRACTGRAATPACALRAPLYAFATRCTVLPRACARLRAQVYARAPFCNVRCNAFCTAVLYLRSLYALQRAGAPPPVPERTRNAPAVAESMRSLFQVIRSAKSRIAPNAHLVGTCRVAAPLHQACEQNTVAQQIPAAVPPPNSTRSPSYY